jgi:hypothetical protein
LWDGP